LKFKSTTSCLWVGRVKAGVIIQRGLQSELPIAFACVCDILLPWYYAVFCVLDSSLSCLNAQNRVTSNFPWIELIYTHDDYNCLKLLVKALNLIQQLLLLS